MKPIRIVLVYEETLAQLYRAFMESVKDPNAKDFVGMLIIASSMRRLGPLEMDLSILN